MYRYVKDKNAKGAVQDLLSGQAILDEQLALVEQEEGEFKVIQVSDELRRLDSTLKGKSPQFKEYHERENVILDNGETVKVLSFYPFAEDKGHIIPSFAYEYKMQTGEIEISILKIESIDHIVSLAS